MSKPVIRRRNEQIFAVEIVGINILGCRGKFNLNDKTSEYGPFLGDPTDNKFNDYQITNGNVMDMDGNVTRPGETQIYGFSKNVKNYLKMPIIQPFIAKWDPHEPRSQSGVYGSQKYGNVCLNNKCLVMGIIDRSEE